MPLVFTRDEIREYLAEMGFGDLNEEDLNKFVQDLRKLIKAESRKRRRRRLGHTGHTYSEISSTTDEATVNSTPRGYDNNIENSISTDQQQQEMQQRRSQPTVTTTNTMDHPQLLYTPKSRLPKTSRHLNNTTSSEYSTTSNSTPHSQSSTTASTTTTTSNGRYHQADSSRGEMSSSFKNSATPTTTVTTTTTDSTGVSDPYFEEDQNVKIRVRRVPLAEDNTANRQKSKHSYETAVDGGSGVRQEIIIGRKAPSKVVSERENTKVFSRQPIEPEDKLVSHPGSAEDVHSNKSNSSSSTDSLSDEDLLRLMEHILKGDITLHSGETSEAGDTGNKKLEIPPKIRRDPVALYHWYKTFWDRQKPPGEDRHMQLRWNVRAGTVGKYPCDADGVKINYLPLNPIKHKKKICAF